MDKLQLEDKTTNVNQMNLSELKNILYMNNKNNKKLDDKIINILNSKIKSLILASESIETETDESIKTESIKTESIETESDESIETEIEPNKNKKFTESSKKIFDRMVSHAEVINNAFRSKEKNRIIKPFIDINTNNKKLGERKNIKIKN
jgi:hypothetical protein